MRGSVVVVGQGYVGLPLALEAAKAGWKVTGLDVSEERVSLLNQGISHIEDVPSEELLQALRESKYSASTDASMTSSAEIVIICVPTPLDGDQVPDLIYIKSAINLIASHLNPETLLISESTSYPGTIREFIKPLIESIRPDKGSRIKYASAPERVDPINSKWNLKNTPRLIAGLTQEASQLAYDFYSSFCEKVIEVSSLEVAESAKLLENTFRQVNIALINQLVPFFRKLGIDTREVVEAAGSKPYGYMKFFPGAGVGGHCIPVDPLYLLWKSRKMGIDVPFIESADRVNREMAQFVVRRLIEIADLKSGDSVLILGVAYKSGISDTRETPAEEVIDQLNSMGIEAFWSDPLVREFMHGTKWEPSIPVNAAIIVTAQPGLDLGRITSLKIPVLDCTGTYTGGKGVKQL